MPDESDNARLSRMLVEIDQDAEGLSEWEVNFVSDLIGRRCASARSRPRCSKGSGGGVSRMDAKRLQNNDFTDAVRKASNLEPGVMLLGMLTVRKMPDHHLVMFCLVDELADESPSPIMAPLIMVPLMMAKGVGSDGEHPLDVQAAVMALEIAVRHHDVHRHVTALRERFREILAPRLEGLEILRAGNTGDLGYGDRAYGMLVEVLDPVVGFQRFAVPVDDQTACSHPGSIVAYVADVILGMLIEARKTYRDAFSLTPPPESPESPDDADKGA
ncbi:MAG: hypothetical protein IT442_05060 [Phycisphaeraceae bacterium]|nr:hypothetical protein [Phycisphaeraceae bacterium]